MSDTAPELDKGVTLAYIERESNIWHSAKERADRSGRYDGYLVKVEVQSMVKINRLLEELVMIDPSILGRYGD